MIWSSSQCLIQKPGTVLIKCTCVRSSVAFTAASFTEPLTQQICFYDVKVNYNPVQSTPIKQMGLTYSNRNSKSHIFSVVFSSEIKKETSHFIYATTVDVPHLTFNKVASKIQFYIDCHLYELTLIIPNIKKLITVCVWMQGFKTIKLSKAFYILTRISKVCFYRITLDNC